MSDSEKPTPPKPTRAPASATPKPRATRTPAAPRAKTAEGDAPKAPPRVERPKAAAGAETAKPAPRPAPPKPAASGDASKPAPRRAPAAAPPASERAPPRAKVAPAPRAPGKSARAAPAPARPADASARSTRVLERLLAVLPERHRDRARNYLSLMRLDRPVGALLLLWPTWWALWLAANDFPPLGALTIFTLGVFVMRSAGCVINDYADHQWLDANVERTRERPLAAGRVSRTEALALFGVLVLIAFGLVLMTNALTIKLSVVGVALAIVYPFAKRVTHLAQVVLGAAFGWSIPMAFAAVTNSLPPLCWLLFLANVLFSTIYDTEYAMVDREDDIRVGAKSTAILFADADLAIIGVLMATFALAMLLVGTRAHLGSPYFLGWAATLALFGWQQWLMRDRSREHCFAAFRNNNAVGLVLWLGLLFALALR